MLIFNLRICGYFFIKQLTIFFINHNQPLIFILRISGYFFYKTINEIVTVKIFKSKLNLLCL